MAGIFPGNFIRWKRPDQEYCGCTVHCYYFPHDDEEFTTKSEERRLAPEFRELWQVLERINRKISQEGNIPSWLEKYLK